MIHKFKFSMGQQVFSVLRLHRVKNKLCEECGGTGYFPAEGRSDLTVRCPGCRGDRHRPAAKGWEWIVHHVLNIGQCRVEINDPEFNNYTKEPIIEQYMCRETGIGSGSLHGAEALFATREQAQAFCDAENARVEWMPIEPS